MDGSSDQLADPESNAFTSLMPVSPPLWPPTTSSLPSASWTCPEQKSCEVWFGTAVNAPVAGFQSRTEGVPPVSHASQSSTLPLGISEACTASSGQFIRAPHWPTWLGSLATSRTAGSAAAGTAGPPAAAGAAASIRSAARARRPAAKSRRGWRHARPALRPAEFDRPLPDPAIMMAFGSGIGADLTPGGAAVRAPDDRPTDLGVLGARLRVGRPHAALRRHQGGPADVAVEEGGSGELECVEDVPVPGPGCRQGGLPAPPGPAAVAAGEQGLAGGGDHGPAVHGIPLG